MNQLSMTRNSIISPVERVGMMLLALSCAFFPLTLRAGYGEDTMSIIDDVKEIEINTIQCNRQARQYFDYVKGDIPILISAPHGAKHYRVRESRWKTEDAYTSSLAIKLGQMTGAHVLYVKNKTAEDPNNDLQSRYKDFLRDVVETKDIKFIIDLHGAGDDEPFKIDVGTLDNRRSHSSCPTFKAIIATAFLGFDKDIFNKRFSAKGAGTITSYARNVLGIEAAQFEINAKYRIIESRSNPAFKANEQDVLDLLERLRAMIKGINDTITAQGSHAPSLSLLQAPR